MVHEVDSLYTRIRFSKLRTYSGYRSNLNLYSAVSALSQTSQGINSLVILGRSCERVHLGISCLRHVDFDGATVFSMYI